MTHEVLRTTPMRGAETTTLPTFKIPNGACDAHFHVFEPGFPPVERPLYTFPDATLEQYLHLAKTLGIERMVLVQPTYYGLDNSLVLDALRRVGPQCRAVVRIGDDISDAELDRFHELGVRAIRLDLFARSSWPLDDIIGYIRQMAERARPRGWHIQFYSPGTLVRDLLPFFGDLEDNFVIDHMGYMLEGEGLTDSDFERLLGVLRNGACWIKAARALPDREAEAVVIGGAHGKSSGSHATGPPPVGIRLAAPARRAA